MSAVPGVDRPTTTAQDWDVSAEAKGRPTLAQLEHRTTVPGIRRPRPRTSDRDVALDFIAGLVSLHLPPGSTTDTTTWCVCVCADRQHRAGDYQALPDERAARETARMTGASHLVARRRLVIGVPPVEVP